VLNQLTDPDKQISAADMETFALDPLGVTDGRRRGLAPRRRRDLKTVERAATDTTSVHHVVENTDETPDDDETVMDWLRTIDADALEDVVNDLLAEHATTILDPDRSRIVIIDFVDNPITDRISPIHAKSVRSMKPRDGTTNCHRYCTAFVLDTKKPLTLAITPVVSDEDAADAVGRVLDRVEQLPFEVDAILADRGYYQERVIRRARATAPVVLPVIKKGKRLLHQLDTHASYWTEYAMYKGKDRELQFPHAVCVSYHNGDRGENGEVVRGYVACDLTDRTPKQVETLYRKRSAIETSYRTYREARESNHHYTRPADSVLYSSLWAFCLRNLWLVVRWTVVARPRRGGRDLPTEFTFELVCGWIRDHLSTELGWQYTWETNGVGLPPGYALATA